jgi:hypothetical protein
MRDLAGKDADARTRLAELADLRHVPSALSVELDGCEEACTMSVKNGSELLVQCVEVVVCPVELEQDPL